MLDKVINQLITTGHHLAGNIPTKSVLDQIHTLGTGTTREQPIQAKLMFIHNAPK